MNPETHTRSATPTASPKHQSMAQSPIRDNTPTKSEEPQSVSPNVVSSPVFDINHESLWQSLSPKKSPPAQVMVRPEGTEFDHKRIPSEWSTASNESLFSIHSNHNSYGQDQANMIALDVIKSGELMNSGDMTRFMVSFSPVGGESDTNSSKVKIPSKSEVPQSGLDEPQRVVRWKSQVEHHVEEKLPSQGDQLESSPLTDHRPNDFSNQASTHPKKKSCCLCNCCFCNWPNLSCWNSCWASISCSSCKSKRICCCSFHSIEVSSPRKGVSPEKLDAELQKPVSHNFCCLGPRFTSSGYWSWSCRCC